MEKLSMCRICLAENIRMCVVVNKNLRDLYERLTDIPFVTDDSRPILACSFCCAKLKQSFRLLRKCLEAEERLAQIMNGSYEPKPLINQDHLEVVHGFIISPIESINIVEVGQTENIVVKEELPANCERQDDILEPKEEYQCDDLELKNQDTSRLDEEDVSALGSEFDSEDDVPLMEFKKEEVEPQEAPKEKRRALDTKSPAVAEEPKRYLRRTQLEDSIPADEKTNQISGSKMIGDTQNRTSKYITEFKKPYECKICHYKCNSTKNNFIKHVRTHTGDKPYKCDICQRSFCQKGNLKTHFRTHTGEKPYKCHICQRSFSQNVNLKNHFRTHPGEKPYKCAIDQSSFSRKFHSTNHIHGKPNKCDICKRSFSKKYFLTIHIRTHTGEKPHKCDICQRSFRVKGALTKHIRIHTGEKPYSCDICLVSFGQKDTLKNHIRTHTGEKPYKCDICQRSFGKKGILRCHIRTHTGEKPYKCDICERSFSDKRDLTKHDLLHTGETPYKCDICQQCFTQKALTRHMRTHTSK